MKKAFLLGPQGNPEQYEKAVMLLQEHNIAAIHEYSIYENTDVATLGPETAAEIRKKAIEGCQLLIVMPDYRSNPFHKTDIETAVDGGLKMVQIEKYYNQTIKWF